jgi:hypothetical protein
MLHEGFSGKIFRLSSANTPRVFSSFFRGASCLKSPRFLKFSNLDHNLVEVLSYNIVSEFVKWFLFSLQTSIASFVKMGVIKNNGSNKKT